MLVVLGISVASLLFLVGSLVRSIQNEKRKGMSVWKNFGLSLSLMTLFFATWIAQGLAQWEKFVDEQEEHNQPAEVSDFMPEFATSTLENWQSEFLQLFSFVVLAALYIHKGSAESRDSEDEMQEALKRIEKHLGTQS